MVHILAASFAVFLANFIFFEACPNRALVSLGQKNPGRPTQLRVAAYALLLMAAIILVDLMGAARGISLWFGIVMSASLASILLGSWRRRIHHILGAGSAFGVVVAVTILGLNVL